MTPKLLHFAQRASPRQRAWRRLLASCTLDPDELLPPIVEPSPQDFVICGHSRSGTALATAALFRPPDVLTVMEPWDCFRLAPADLFNSVRSEIGSSGRLTRGRLDVDVLKSTGAVAWQRDGERSFNVELQSDYKLGIKMPAFWRYLGSLPATKFIVCLRNPIDVIASYGRVGGRLSQGLDYDVAFNRRMNSDLQRATDDPFLRRIAMFDYVGARVAEHIGDANVHVVRYERWHQDPAGQLSDIGRFLGVDLNGLRVAIHDGTRTVDPAEARLIAHHCRTATSLGYDLDSLNDAP